MTETELTSSRSDARAAKTAYDTAVQSRSNAQHEVNILLERKHSWTDTDVSQFTNLVRQDHTSSHSVTATSAQLRDAEQHVDVAFSALTKAILQRYHEEQVWSDKIRNVSTWVNLAGLVINLVVFVGAIAIVEPWKRRRLVERVEERMTNMIGKVESEVKGLASLVAGARAGTPLQLERMQMSPTLSPLLDHGMVTAPLSPIGTPPKLPPRLDSLFALRIWRQPMDYVTAPSAEKDLAVAGGLVLGMGMVLGSLVSYVMR